MRYTDGLVIGISQSGASPTWSPSSPRRAGLRDTNDPASPMADAATHVIELHTGEERSVAATKTYTTSLAAAAALAAGIAGDAGKSRELAGVPDALRRQLARLGGIDELAIAAADWRFAAVGAGTATAH